MTILMWLRFLHTLEDRGPQAVQMVGKHGPGVDVERREGAPAERLQQRVDLGHQQIRSAVEQVHREEEFPTRNPIATIIRHDRSMLGVGEGRKALRFSALRLLLACAIYPGGDR